MKKQKILRVILSLLAVVFILSGCSKTDKQPAKENGVHTVTDHAGREVTVPDEINRIVILDITPLPSVYCMVAGNAEKIVGMTPASKNVAVNSLLNKVAPELTDVETGFAKGETINTEELLMLNPDVIFYRMETQADAEAVEKLSIPAVAFSTALFKGNTIDTLNGWVQLLADVFNDDSISERADKIIKAGKEAEEFVKERVAELSEEERTQALVLHNYDESGIKAGGTTFARYYLETVGADNVGAGVEGLFQPVTLEQIYEWNPQVIFLNSFSGFAPEDFYNNTAVEGDDWSGIKAVQEQRIYKYPIGMYYWFPPCSDAPLSIQWTAKSLYPELFADVDIMAKTKAYYKEFYDLDLSEEELEGIFNPSKEAAFTP